MPEFDQAELLKALEEEEAALLDEVVAPVKPQRLTIQLIAERCIDRSELAALSSDDLAERLLTFQRLRLDRLRLGSMDGLDVCNAATHLHLLVRPLCPRASGRLWAGLTVNTHAKAWSLSGANRTIWMTSRPSAESVSPWTQGPLPHPPSRSPATDPSTSESHSTHMTRDQT